ncbi:MAG: NTP transferase domain-containing protein [Phycisphaerae bacterium]|nr:NTP transferase domain-containing protein [Gemmatimonadaceae bacterium]
MKVIIPLAGKGTRLRPHTHVTPKPMLKVAGRPVMSYVMDDVAKLGDVEQVVYITGHLKEKVELFAKGAYQFPSLFIEQNVQDGTAGAVNLAKPWIDQPVLIIFVDTIFDADLSIVHDIDADGVIWTMEVEDYQRFGVVVTDEHGFMTKIVEKPTTPISKRANIGLYYIRNWKLLYEGIEHVLTTPPNKGEWYLTDAFQYMIDKGARIKVVDVEGWHDAGQLETLLATNRTMLEKGRARQPDGLASSVTIVPPVYIEDGVTIENSTIGPNVSLGTGSEVHNSTLRDCVIGEKAKIRDASLHDSFIGDGALIHGVSGALNIGDQSEVRSDSTGPSA